MPSSEKFVSELKCHSGDILNFYASEKRVSSFVSPADQSNQALKPLFERFKPTGQIQELCLKPVRTKPAYPKITCSKYPECHELTLKIFVQFATADIIEKCLQQVMEELEFTYIDFVILSFDEKESEENIDCVWSQLHDQKILGHARQIGVADFCKHKLEALISRTGIQPDIDQLAPAAGNGFCGISPGLMEFAKEKEIKLKTHGDPCCTPADMSREINRIVLSENSNWRTLFLSRYSQVSKDRLCITKKGFTAQFRLYS